MRNGEFLKNLDQKIKNRLLIFAPVVIVLLLLGGGAAFAELHSYPNATVLPDSISATGGAPLLSTSAGRSDTLYQAIFYPRNYRHWSGDLRKYVYEANKFELSKDWKLQNSSDPVTAGTILGETSPENRTIYTPAFTGFSGNGTTHMALLNADAVSNSGRLAALSGRIGITKAELGLATDAEAIAVQKRFIQWYRGYTDVSDSTETKRTDKLFDIYHSGMVVVGAPGAGIKDGTYPAFAETYKDRPMIVYVQTNDGLLHAFNDADGKERWAFLPPNVRAKIRLRGLKWKNTVYTEAGNLTKPDIPRLLGDGPLIAEDVLFDGETDYRTVLFGQLGFGGAGMYVLDITNPDLPRFVWALENSFEDNKQFSNTKNDNTGVSVWIGSNGPVSADAKYAYENLRKTGSTGFIGFYKSNDGTGEKRNWVFLMGNGAEPGNTGFQEAEVFVGKVSDGTLVKSILSPISGQKGNIVTPVAVPLSSTKEPRHIESFYVGDSMGRIFKGTLPSDVGNWKMETLFSLGGTSGMSYSLDVATLNTSRGEEVWLFAGTGDLENFVVPRGSDKDEYFFAINTQKISSNDPISKLENVSNLAADAPSTNEKGWYLFFPKASGERITTAPVIVNGVLYFGTTVTETDSKGTVISQTARVYAVDAKTGLPMWTINGKKHRYFTVKDGIVSGISIAGKRLAIGVTFVSSAREWSHTDFTLLGANILYTDTAMPGGGEDAADGYRMMSPLYWKTR